ncbi:hypothetical protein DRQ19_02390 [bacterium]|nr:MAG: hypothetical protein DRQ19_02390 [bacterium]
MEPVLPRSNIFLILSKFKIILTEINIKKSCEQSIIQIRNRGGDMQCNEDFVHKLVWLPKGNKTLWDFLETLNDENLLEISLDKFFPKRNFYRARFLEFLKFRGKKLDNCSLSGNLYNIASRNELRNAIYLLLLNDILFDKPLPLNKPEFIRHSLKVALLCEMLTELIGEVGYSDSESFAAGLLHDIGVILLAGNFPERYRRAFGHSIMIQIPMYASEREIFGFDHGEVGGWFLQNRGFSSWITDAARFHHDPGKSPKSSRKLVSLVAYANELAKRGAYIGVIETRKYNSYLDPSMEQELVSRAEILLSRFNQGMRKAS